MFSNKVEREDKIMAKRREVNYFNIFVELVNYSCKAANLLNEVMNNYNPDKLQDKMKEMHEIEHSADEARHVMIKKLAREFITPIEREDIMALADSIDNVTDSIDDVLMHMYIRNVKTVRDYAIKMSEVIVKCCDTLKLALSEFHNFRKSKNIHQLIIEVNRLEEIGDKYFREALRELYVNSDDFKEIAAWDRTYDFLEVHWKYLNRVGYQYLLYPLFLYFVL
jgi:predicted phosphate transport protein (TIGR00153 family)